jgi:hypothetical protein
LFTFLEQAEDPFDNNHAERSIRPATILHNNNFGNRYQRGADCQARLISLCRNGNQHGHDPIRTVVALEQCRFIQQLLFPINATSDG